MKNRWKLLLFAALVMFINGPCGWLNKPFCQP